MKTKAIICLFVAMILCSCGGGEKFAPKEDSTKLSAEERKEKINDIKDAKTLEGASLLNPNDIQISVVVPDVNGGNVSENMGNRIAAKMLHMAAENGISGLGVSSAFVLGADINQIGSETTSTVPQRMVVKYEIVYKVMNTADGTVYATYTQEISGAGGSFKRADINAVSNLKSTPGFRKMLSQASQKIIEWYNANLPTLKSKVESARADGNYALAMALVRAVPQKATEAFSYATGIHNTLMQEFKTKEANNNLQAMIALIGSSNEDFNPEIAGYFSLIPVDSPQFKEAQAAYDKYQSRCNARMRELEAKAEKDAEAARNLEILKLNLDNQKDLAQIEADKVVAKAEAKANAAAMEHDMQAQRDSKKGFWGSLGNRILNGIDAVGEKLSGEDDD